TMGLAEGRADSASARRSAGVAAPQHLAHVTSPARLGNRPTKKTRTTTLFRRIECGSPGAYDALGTTRLLTSTAGATTDTYLFDAWGNAVSSTGSTVNPFRWVGRYGYYTDNTTGLVYVRARMYAPTIARWVSVDPILDLLLLLTDNSGRHLYCQANPIGEIDSSGKACRIEQRRSKNGTRTLKEFVQPESDPYFPVTHWTPEAVPYPVETLKRTAQHCGGCTTTIELVSYAQRFYRTVNGQHVDHRGAPLTDRNDPRDFASLLLIKVCYSDIICPCATPPDYDEEWEHLFYRNGLGTYIQYSETNEEGTVIARGIRQARDTFIVPEPACDIGAMFLYHIRANTIPGDGKVKPTGDY
ncbi:MAG: RHS repeat-associated core domain-containing protein, partial [Planctomyces sp.]|nr:RHS repeat-associated core domain-containing protein [Planctomyces sp.]